MNFLTKIRTKSLNNRLIIFVLLCWVIPILIFSTFVTFSYQEGIMEKSDEMITAGVGQMADLISLRINEAIELCQKPSYEKVWEYNYNVYRKQSLSKNKFIQNMGDSLTKSFGLDSRFILYAFYNINSDEPDFYSSKIGQPLSNYVEKVNDQIINIIDSKSNYTIVKIIDERIFIIRNLYMVTRFEPFGTLVVELNKSRLARMIDKEIIDRVAICINDSQQLIRFSEPQGMEALQTDEKEEVLLNDLLKDYRVKNKNKVTQMRNKANRGYMLQKSYERYHMGLILIMPRKEAYPSLYKLYEIIGIVLILFIPVIVYIVIFLKRQIRQPVATLVRLAKEVEKGNFGFAIRSSMPNTEFNYLMDSFNNMSLQVKYLFDDVYSEKLAKKDAQILALQAQINPHFLNNTLEMMNWQARMSGDIIVSKMIEALGTVLDYRINRSNVKEIYLVEELKCADAYFYIMSMRFGQRLHIMKEIDEEVFYMNVPPLILQPLIENAIVHGVEKIKSGTISLHVYHDERDAFLMVKNSGKELSKEEYDKINWMLSGDTGTIPKGFGRHTSIGIRNVNQRIKLVYGEEYGLSIYREDNMTVSKIVIPFKIDDIKNQAVIGIKDEAES